MKDHTKRIYIAILSLALIFVLAMGGISFAEGNATDIPGNGTEGTGTTDINGGGESGTGTAIVDPTPVETSNATDLAMNGTSGGYGDTFLSEESEYFDISGIADKTYNGKAQIQAIVVKKIRGDAPRELVEGQDYEVTYKNNINAGTASVIITGIGDFSGEVTKTFNIKKAANPLKVSPKTATVKAKALKKKDQKLAVSKVITIKGAKTKRTFKLVSVNKKKFKKYFKIDSKTGKVTVKKKLKKGTYKIKVKITAAANNNYKGVSKTVTFKIKVK